MCATSMKRSQEYPLSDEPLHNLRGKVTNALQDAWRFHAGIAGISTFPGWKFFQRIAYEVVGEKQREEVANEKHQEEVVNEKQLEEAVNDKQQEEVVNEKQQEEVVNEKQHEEVKREKKKRREDEEKKKILIMTEVLFVRVR